MAKSKAHIAGHPIHPMLVVLPLGSFVLALVADVIFLLQGDVFWRTAASYLISAGIIGGLLAGAMALPDYFSFQVGSVEHRTATMHALINGTVLLLAVFNAGLRLGGAVASDPLLWVTVGLSAVVVALLLVSGWLGGELVYRHGVAVVREAPVIEPVWPQGEERERPAV